MPRGERERGREREREREILDMKKAPLLRRAALKNDPFISNNKNMMLLGVQICHIWLSVLMEAREGQLVLEQWIFQANIRPHFL